MDLAEHVHISGQRPHVAGYQVVHVKLAREGQIDLNARSGEDKPGFVEVKPDGAVAQMMPEEPMKVCVIRIRFNNGLVLSRRGGDVEEVISAIRESPKAYMCSVAETRG